MNCQTWKNSGNVICRSRALQRPRQRQIPGSARVTRAGFGVRAETIFS